MAEALVVSVVVAMAVEPYLLRHFGEELESFGEELATQTFWTSFYARAPVPYREAIQELTGEEQFSIHAEFLVTLDWVDAKKSMVRITTEFINHRENRGSAAYRLRATSFVFESAFENYPAKFLEYSVICEDNNLYIDFLKDDSVNVVESEDGRLLLQTRTSDPNIPQFTVPPGARYTTLSKTLTFSGPSGFAPLIIVRPALRLTVQFFGSALPDLYVSLLHFGAPRHRMPVNPLIKGYDGNGAALAARGKIQVGGVFITGQSVLMSWKSQLPAMPISPRNRRKAPRRDSSPTSPPSNDDGAQKPDASHDVPRPT
jgi:hypothetical protein